MGKKHQYKQGFGSRQVGGLRKNVHFLILSEDTESSVLYFTAMIASVQPARHSQVIGISSTVEGVGRGTGGLLKKAKAKKIEVERKSQIPFDRCWLVFDKDDFKDFNQTIREAEKAGFEVAWSNESFELWYLLHFRYQSTGLGRKECIKTLEKEIRKHDPKFKYEKGNTDMYRILSEIGDQSQAIKFAQKLRDSYTDENYDSHNPCTRVDMLVKVLTDPEERKKILGEARRTK